jgi:hypothetical protein
VTTVSYYGLIFLFSVFVDLFAVQFTEAVRTRNYLTGSLSTAAIASMNWISTIWVVKYDSGLAVPAIMGHVVGFLLGTWLLPSGSGTAGPTTGPGSQNSDPS